MPKKSYSGAMIKINFKKQDFINIILYLPLTQVERPLGMTPFIVFCNAWKASKGQASLPTPFNSCLIEQQYPFAPQVLHLPPRLLQLFQQS